MQGAPSATRLEKAPSVDAQALHALIFLKYISDSFEARQAELESQRDQDADPEDPDEYCSANIFRLQPRLPGGRHSAHRRAGQAAAGKGGGEGGRDQHPGLFPDAPGQLSGDEGVGAQRQVIAVLLGDAYRQEDGGLPLEVGPHLPDRHMGHAGKRIVRHVSASIREGYSFRTTSTVKLAARAASAPIAAHTGTSSAPTTPTLRGSSR